MENSKRRSILGLVFLTVFLDLVGFSVIFPLFPAMLEHYVGLEGEGSLVGRLEAWLRSMAGGETAPVAGALSPMTSPIPRKAVYFSS